LTSRQHILFNLTMITISWLSLIFLGKRNIKRYFLASTIIGIFEMINHIYGHQHKWWSFYDKPRSLIRNEFSFDIGPYIPISMWILKLSYGNFKKFALLNALLNALYVFLFVPLLKKINIVRLNRLNYFQFFLYIHYKAYILYGAQYLFEKIRLENYKLT
jgi:hypothetical protein